MAEPLRIIICTKRDLIGCLILNQLLPRLAGCDLRVLLSNKTRPAEGAVAELAEMKFLERDLPLDTIFPMVDALGGGGRLATFQGLARRFDLTVDVVTGINTPESEELVRAFRPDAIISIRFSHIFKRRIFDIPRFGTFNVHPGALPRYAGLFAPFHCMLDGAPSIGATLHRVDDGIDTGPVVGIGHLPIDPARSLLWHVANAYWPGLEHFLRMVDAWQSGGAVEAMAQDFSHRLYRSMPDAATFADFRARGFKLYDPAQYAELLAGFLPPGFGVGTVTIPKVTEAPCSYARA